MNKTAIMAKKQGYFNICAAKKKGKNEQLWLKVRAVFKT
jgi:hypothetical protein